MDVIQKRYKAIVKRHNNLIFFLPAAGLFSCGAWFRSNGGQADAGFVLLVALTLFFTVAYVTGYPSNEPSADR